MTPEQMQMFQRMRALFPGITQASPPMTSTPQGGLDFLRQSGFGGGRIAGPMSTPGGSSSFYRQFGIGPNTRLSEFGRTGPRTTMPNLRAAIQAAAPQADDVAAAAADDVARAAVPSATRGLGGLFLRTLGSTPFGALINALIPTRMGGATFDDIELRALPEAMSTLPGGGMSVPISDSGARSPAQDSMSDALAPSPMGMPGMLESPSRPDVPSSPPPVPSVQSGFGFDGFDSAAVSEGPDMAVLSIDVLPSRSAPEMPAAPGVMDAPARAAAPAVRELAPSMSARPQMRPEMQGPAMPMYEVQSGDYLGKIAQNVGLPLADLIALNPQIENPDLIFPGQMLNLG